jgi:predicted benzoate:H+ symporter BenE
MPLIVTGAAVMLAGLALLLAMVVRVIEPSLALSLLGYASLFIGMFLTLPGATRLRG